MRAPVAAILASVVSSLFVLGSASGGIDEAYEKPHAKGTWGDLLETFTGHSGFNKSYALIVGISQFEHYDNLPTANDPLRMRDFLLDEAGFDYVHVLTDDKATKTRIDELMVDVLPAMIGDKDRFLFYWSGHGEQRLTALGGHIGYLPLASSPKSRYSTMVSMSDLPRWDALLEARQVLFLFDACFSGLAGNVSKAARRNLKIDQLAKPAHQLLTAGSADEETIASDRWGGSIFTDAVIRAIRGDADAGADGIVSFYELIEYVKSRVALEAPAAGWTKPITPQSRDLRGSTGEFFFLTSEYKMAKFRREGGQQQGRLQHGMPVPDTGPRDIVTLQDGYRIQVAAVRDEADARRAWDLFLSILGPVLRGVQPIIERAKNENGTYYRLQAGPIATFEGATLLCEELNRHHFSCFVVRR